MEGVAFKEVIAEDVFANNCRPRNLTLDLGCLNF